VHSITKFSVFLFSFFPFIIIIIIIIILDSKIEWNSEIFVQLQRFIRRYLFPKWLEFFAVCIELAWDYLDFPCIFRYFEFIILFHNFLSFFLRFVRSPTLVNYVRTNCETLPNFCNLHYRFVARDRGYSGFSGIFWTSNWSWI